MIALIILNYNNAEATRSCIASVLEHNTAPVKFVVIDNGSRPEELAALRRVLDVVLPGYEYITDGDAPACPALAKAVLIRSDKNLGYACGNNFGLRHVYADPEVDYIMILNNDILFTEDMIPTLAAAYTELPQCAILSPLLKKKGNVEIDFNCARRSPSVGDLTRRNFLFYWWVLARKKYAEARPDLFLIKGDGTDPEIVEVEMPSGSCMLVDKKYFESIGGFDPNTFLYYEENILHKKIQRTGRKIYLHNGASCIHLGAQTTNLSANKTLFTKFGLQSEDYYVTTYCELSTVQKVMYKLSKACLQTCLVLHEAFNKLRHKGASKR